MDEKSLEQRIARLEVLSTQVDGQLKEFLEISSQLGKVLASLAEIVNQHNTVFQAFTQAVNTGAAN